MLNFITLLLCSPELSCHRSCLSAAYSLLPLKTHTKMSVYVYVEVGRNNCRLSQLCMCKGGLGKKSCGPSLVCICRRVVRKNRCRTSRVCMCRKVIKRHTCWPSQVGICRRVMRRNSGRPSRVCVYVWGQKE